MHDLTRRTGRPSSWLLNSLNAGELPASTPVPREGGLTLGRADDNGLAVPARLFPGVSARHARLTVEGDALVLEDLGSSNGTWVDGRAIEREEIPHGTVFELGLGGPRFVAVCPSRLHETVAMPRPAGLAAGGAKVTAPAVAAPAVAAKPRSIGTETMHLVRETLGLPGTVSVEQLVRRRSHRTRWMMVGLTLLTLAGTGVVYRVLGERTDRENRRLRAQLAAHREAAEQQAAEIAARDERLEVARLAWEADKAALEEERRELESSIRRVLADEEATGARLENLRDQLRRTNETLELYDPLNLEQRRLQEVARVERCTVLIESDQLFVDEHTGRVLHIDRDTPFGPSVNLEGKGEPLKVEATGSGFCVTDGGWIVTNAHVVHKKHEEPPLDVGPEIRLVPRIEVRVVFSGESERHDAELVRWTAAGNDDLALLRIEPFEGMPYLEEPLLSAPPPSRGTEVFLIGFPLGKRVFHQGDVMLASTFKGVLSRVLDDYLQVDAAVHPGASGGPLIDGSGNLLGVVVGMQTVEDGATASAIGYVIPVGRLAGVWPPPADEPAALTPAAVPVQDSGDDPSDE